MLKLGNPRWTFYQRKKFLKMLVSLCSQTNIYIIADFVGNAISILIMLMIIINWRQIQDAMKHNKVQHGRKKKSTRDTKIGYEGFNNFFQHKFRYLIPSTCYLTLYCGMACDQNLVTCMSRNNKSIYFKRTWIDKFIEILIMPLAKKRNNGFWHN